MAESIQWSRNTGKYRIQRDLIAISEPLRVLDVGAVGTGPLDLWSPLPLDRMALEVVAVNVDAEGVQRARELGLPIELRRVSGYELVDVFGPAAFDLALATQVLERVARPVDFMTQIGAVLKPGGRVWGTLDSAHFSRTHAGDPLWKRVPGRSPRGSPSATTTSASLSRPSRPSSAPPGYGWRGCCTATSARSSRWSRSWGRRRRGRRCRTGTSSSAGSRALLSRAHSGRSTSPRPRRPARATDAAPTASERKHAQPILGGRGPDARVLAMCGICGFVGRRPVADGGAVVEAMADAIRHSGPGGGGGRELGSRGEREALSGWLGHRRLKIIDLSELAEQPMVSPHGAAMTFNGEVYNFRELRRELEARGHRLRSSGDTEVVLHAYLEWGADFVSRLDVAHRPAS